MDGVSAVDEKKIRAALQKVEETRKHQGLSVRDATSRIPHISEGYWRQFMAGGVKQSDVWIPRVPTVDQVLRMAAAVGIGEEIAADLGVESPEPNNPYTDPDERALWGLTLFSEGERRAWIELMRERRRAAG